MKNWDGIHINPAIMEKSILNQKDINFKIYS